MRSRLKSKTGLALREAILFAMLGAITFCSKLMMEGLPNIHLVGMLTVTFTLVYRWKALYPIYVYVFLQGLVEGFTAWWVPNLYIWTLLWGAVMLLPQHMPKWLAPILYALVCGIHGFLYGTLFAPWQALVWHLNWDGMLAWIVSGLPFDVTHGIGNLCFGALIVPLSLLLRKLDKSTGIT